MRTVLKLFPIYERTLKSKLNSIQNVAQGLPPVENIVEAYATRKPQPPPFLGNTLRAKGRKTAFAIPAPVDSFARGGRCGLRLTSQRVGARAGGTSQDRATAFPEHGFIAGILSIRPFGSLQRPSLPIALLRLQTLLRQRRIAPKGA